MMEKVATEQPFNWDAFLRTFNDAYSADTVDVGMLLIAVAAGRGTTPASTPTPAPGQVWKREDGRPLLLTQCVGGYVAVYLDDGYGYLRLEETTTDAVCGLTYVAPSLAEYVAKGGKL